MTHPDLLHRFPDHRAQLYGRDQDISQLLHRAKHPGLTVVSGRPRIGKSWTLTEMARRMSLELDYLVGYFRSTGEGSDSLLRSVSDAYAQWLAEATYADQGKSLWRRHKDDLVGKTGEAVGKLLKDLGDATYPGLSALTNRTPETFSGLARLDQDLKTGGLTLPRLSYEQARDLLHLLHRLSGKAIVLIHDAWEKSTDFEREANILETFLDETRDWPPVHLFLAVRVETEEHPVVRRARELTAAPASQECELGVMDLDREVDAGKMLTEVRGLTGAAGKDVDDEGFLALVAGYPGVLDHWRERSVSSRATLQAARIPSFRPAAGRTRVVCDGSAPRIAS